MSNKTRKKYFVVYPGSNMENDDGYISGQFRTRESAREFRVPFDEKIVKVEYTVKPNGMIEIINQKQVR